MDRQYSSEGLQLGLSSSGGSLSQQDLDTPRKKRGAYLCSKCGEPKKGHVCKLVDAPMAAVAPSPMIIKKRRKTSQGSGDVTEEVEQSGIVLHSLTDKEEQPKSEIYNPQMNNIQLSTSLAEPAGKKYIKPIEINQSVAEPRDVQTYRKMLAKIAALAHDACNSVIENQEVFTKKAKRWCNELLKELSRLQEKYNIPISDDKIAQLINGESVPSPWSFSEYRTEEYWILYYLQVFTEEIDTEWTDDKGLGIKGVLEDKLYSLWEASLRKLKPTMEAIGIAEWLMVIIKHDKTGRMKLISDKEFIDAEILKYALQTHIACFQESPTFDTYKDIIERQVFIGEDINRLKNGLLNALTLNNLVHVKTRILILLHEKQYTSLKETIKALRSSDVIIDAAKQISHLFPHDMIEKAEKEIEKAVNEAAIELEEMYDVNAEAFTNWKQAGFKTNHDQKTNGNEAENAMEEEYPHDHYLTLVKNVFIMGDVELRDYKEYMEKYAPYENQNVTLNNPFEYFRDLRQKEKISTRILQTILGWVQVAKQSFQAPFDHKGDSLEHFLQRITLKAKAALGSSDKGHVPIVSAEIADLAKSDAIIQKQLFELVALFKAIQLAKLSAFVLPKLQQ